MEIKYTECRGKVLDKISVVDDEPYQRSIVIYFQDKTTMSFDLLPTVRLEPELQSWKAEDGRCVKRYRAA